MKVICEKYKEEMEAEQALCRHGTEYCKFRTSCLIHFIAKERKPEKEKSRQESNGPDGK